MGYTRAFMGNIQTVGLCDFSDNHGTFGCLLRNQGREVVRISKVLSDDITPLLTQRNPAIDENLMLLTERSGELVCQ